VIPPRELSALTPKTVRKPNHVANAAMMEEAREHIKPIDQMRDYIAIDAIEESMVHGTLRDRAVKALNEYAFQKVRNFGEIYGMGTKKMEKALLDQFKTRDELVNQFGTVTIDSISTMEKK
jgi:hypothetical protein